MTTAPTPARRMEAAIRAGDTGAVRELVQSGLSPNRPLEPDGTDPWGLSPLALAASLWDVEMTKTLITLGAQPSRTYRDGDTALHAAMERLADNRGGMEAFGIMLRLLGDSPAGMDPRNLHSDTPLCIAIRRGADREMIAAMLAAGSRPAGLSSGQSPLLMAAAFGNTGALEALADADPHLVQRTDSGDLLTAAINGPRSLLTSTHRDALGAPLETVRPAPDVMPPALEPVHRFLSDPASCARLTYFGRCKALEAAAGIGCAPAVRFLLGHIEPAARATCAQSALHHACAAGRARALQLLLEAGADPRAPMGNGALPLQMLAQRGKTLPPGEVSRSVALLLGAGADPRMRDDTRRTAADIAAERETPEMLEALHAAGAPMDEPDSEGCTPLLRACLWGRDANAAFLLAQGADINARTGGYTAMHRAALGHSADDSPGHIACLRMLADAGLAVDEPSDDGETALFLAATGGRVARVAALLAAGADPTASDYQGEDVIDVLNQVPSLDQQRKDTLTAMLRSARARRALSGAMDMTGHIPGSTQG